MIAYLSNLGALQREVPAIAARVEPYKHALAALLLVNEQRQDHLRGLLGLETEYEVVRSPGKSIYEPFSEEGDLDGDYASNLTEYESLVASGGNIEDFAALVTNPLVGGPPVPALSLVGLALLSLAFLAMFTIQAWHLERRYIP